MHRRRRTTEIARNPHPPQGLRRDAAHFFVAAPRRYEYRLVADASNWTTSRSQLLLRYFRNGALAPDRTSIGSRLKPFLAPASDRQSAHLALPLAIAKVHHG